MFTSAEMVTLNETLADIVGREIGDRAREMLLEGEALPPSPCLSPDGDCATPLPAPESGRHDRDEHFGFNEEMRETRLRVDELLAGGNVGEAEAYMKERRLFFVENGYPIRRLNQAYFAFHGTYAENAASSSPIAGTAAQVQGAVARPADVRPEDGGHIELPAIPRKAGRLGARERKCGTINPSLASDAIGTGCTGKTNRK